jgi:hypothetical protein
MAQTTDNYLNISGIPNQYIKTAIVNYILIDSVEELEKLITDIASGKKYCELYIQDGTTYKQVSITRQTKRGKKYEGIYPLRKKVVVEEVLYIVDGNQSQAEDAETLHERGIYRKPIFSKFNSQTEYTGTDDSLYLGGVQSVNVDVDAQKEQRRVLDDKVLQALAPLRTDKTIFLYAKDVKTQKYSKVSLSKEAADIPVPTIYINDISNKTRSQAETEEKDKLQNDIKEKEDEIKAINGADDKSLTMCAALSSESMVRGIDAKKLGLNKKKATDKIQKLLNVAQENMKNFSTYVQSVLKYGKPVTLEEFNKNYILIISTKPWEAKSIPVIGGPADVSTVNETSTDTRTVSDATNPNAIAPYQKADGPTTTSGFLSGFNPFGSASGGRRKTKKSNKKSRKQSKSKKQAKSRKLFKGFMY